MKLKNLYIALKEQLPLKRMFTNFLVTGNALGMFSISSHQRKDGKVKVMYNTKKSATRASESMMKKYPESKFSAYKCIFCDGYHVGKKRV